MNEKIKLLWDTALEEFSKEHQFATIMLPAPLREKFAELLLANLADELIAVATASKKANPEWANGMNHAAMLAQRMLMNLPEEE